MLYLTQKIKTHTLIHSFFNQCKSYNIYFNIYRLYQVLKPTIYIYILMFNISYILHFHSFVYKKALVIYNQYMEKDYLPINPTPISETEALQKNANVLAFIGDAVQTLYARTKVADTHDYNTGVLHIKVAKEVCAKSQAKALNAITSSLNELETMVYKRSRNVTKSSKSKNANVAEYNIASGLEGLIGFLYLVGNHDRLKKLLEKAYELNNQDC